jgi:hypothetical protein
VDRAGVNGRIEVILQLLADRLGHVLVGVLREPTAVSLS